VVTMQNILTSSFLTITLVLASLQWLFIKTVHGDGELLLCLLSLRVKNWRRRFFSNTRSLGKLSYILKKMLVKFLVNIID